MLLIVYIFKTNVTELIPTNLAVFFFHFLVHVTLEAFERDIVFNRN